MKCTEQLKHTVNETPATMPRPQLQLSELKIYIHICVYIFFAGHRNVYIYVYTYTHMNTVYKYTDVCKHTCVHLPYNKIDSRIDR